MFFSNERRIEAGFAAARDRLAGWASGALLREASDRSYDEGIAVLQVGPAGGVPGLSKLVEVRVQDLVTHGNTARMALRWEVTGPAAGLFPVLDADITLAPDGDDAAVLRLDGAYRPPLAPWAPCSTGAS